jgi:hypothetical protein
MKEILHYPMENFYIHLWRISWRNGLLGLLLGRVLLLPECVAWLLSLWMKVIWLLPKYLIKHNGCLGSREIFSSNISLLSMDDMENGGEPLEFISKIVVILDMVMIIKYYF